MRLLDRTAQYSEPTVIVGPDGTGPLRVIGPADFAAAVRHCPVRYVLADRLTRECSELAFADGDRLTACLDLIRIPAPSLWVEWADDVQQDVLLATGLIARRDLAATGRRVDGLLVASSCGRRGTIRTFWSGPPEAPVTLAPIETDLDLTGDFPCDRLGEDVLAGGTVRLHDELDPTRNPLSDCLRFRFDRRWAAAYRAMAMKQGDLDQVLRGSVGSVAHDMPLLLALFLLLNARCMTQFLPAKLGALNRKRLRLDKAALLEHLEVRSTIANDAPPRLGASPCMSDRCAARLHYVRAHLVRRDNSVFWRRAHLRGKAAIGVIRSRTVRLSFASHHQPH